MFGIALLAGGVSVMALVLTMAYQHATAKLRRDLVWVAFMSVVSLASLLAVVVLT